MNKRANLTQLNFCWLVKSGFNEFGRQSVLPHLNASWSTDLEILSLMQPFALRISFKGAFLWRSIENFWNPSVSCKNCFYVGLLSWQQAHHIWCFHHNSIWFKPFSLRRDLHERSLVLCPLIAFYQVIFPREIRRLRLSHYIKGPCSIQNMTWCCVFGALIYQFVFAGRCYNYAKSDRFLKSPQTFISLRKKQFHRRLADHCFNSFLRKFVIESLINWKIWPENSKPGSYSERK